MKKQSFGKISIVVSDEPEKNWNDFILKSEYGSYFQTMEYASARKKFFGHIPKFLRFKTSDDKIVGQLLLFQTRLGVERFRKYFGFSKFSSIYQNLAFPVNNLYWSYGPLILDIEFKEEIMFALGKFLQSEKCNFYGYSNPLDGLIFPSNFDFRIENKATFIIDFSQNLETIFLNTDKNSVRKNIKRAEERGIKVHLIKSEEDIINHFKLLKEHRARNNLKYASKEIVLENFRIGKNKGLAGFLAEFENQPVASIIFTYLNGQIYEEGITRSMIDIQKKLYAQELLRWNIIKWGKENDCKFYDLAGVKVESRTTKEDGIFRNKKKWGGKLIRYLSYSNK